MIRILHFADLHLGVENYGRLDPATGLSSRVADFLRAFDALVEYALTEGVDLVLFAGDAFKTRTPSPTYQREFASRIRRLAVDSGIPTFLLVGNHDLPLAAGRAHSVEIFQTLEVQNVYVTRQPAVWPVETRHGPLQIVALPWIVRSAILTHEAYKERNLEEINELMLQRLEELLVTGEDSLVSQLDPQVPTVLVAHGTVQGAVYGSERSVMLGGDLVLPRSLICHSAFDYVALGHIHKHQVVSEAPPAVYAGSLERLDFGEEKEAKGFVVVDLARGRAEYRFVPLETRPFVTIRVRATAPDPMAQVLAAIAERDITDAVVRLQIELPAEAEPLLDEGAIRKSLDAAFYVAAVAREVERPTRLRLGGQETIEALTPRELLARYLQARQVPAARAEVLLHYADELFAETGEKGG
ncbi:MAG: exonuclease SbcCD subunit D [Anaerolineae bacterium]|nr:exonuclease SbcCD subunit D [Anaerolineae bacterium]